MSVVLGSDDYWHSGGANWLVFFRRPDGKFAVIGSELHGVYASREEFVADDDCRKADGHLFVYTTSNPVSVRDELRRRDGGTARFRNQLCD